MALQFVTKVCTGCGHAFKTSNDSEKCYDCTLEDTTHGLPPEEGDFNTAGIISGTLTEEERNNLQSDLEQVENGGTIYPSYFVDEDEHAEREESDDREYAEQEAAKWGDEG